MTYLSRPTVYLAASLLLLPGTGHAATPQRWTCLPTAGGGWSCAPAAGGNAAQPTPAQQDSAPELAVSQAPTTAPAATASLRSNDWDWVAEDAAPAGAQCYQPSGACAGVYVEPAHSWQDSDKSPKGLPAHATASEVEWQGDIIKMNGGVVVTQGNTRLTADRADMTRSDNQLNLYGNVVVQQPHLKVTGSNADMTTDNNFGHVIDAQMLDYKSGIRVTADKLTRRKENLVELDRATYTRCPPDGEVWRLDARHIRLNKETGRGEAGDTVIRVDDLPVFYTPYMNFPIDDRRQTGFLWPLIGKSSSGFDLAVPYYINLAPNYDATLTPRVVTDHGTMLEAEGRYLNQYSNWVVSGAELPSDKNSGDKRWIFATQEHGNLNSYFSTNIDYTRVSDNDYFSDFSISSLNAKRQTALSQSASLNLNYLDWSASLAVQQYQIIDDLVAEPYRKMPQLTIQRSANGENFTPDYSVVTEFTHFDFNDPSVDRVVGDRVYIEPGVSFPMRWTASYFNPEFRMRYVGYNLNWPDSTPGATHPQTAVPETILDSGLYFERDTSLFGSDYQQTLEPRLYYLYSPYQKQLDQPLFDTQRLTFDYAQLFQPRRLTGHDRLEDFNQLATGVTSRIIENDSGEELGRASIGQIFYFSNRHVDATSTESVDDQASSAVAGQVVIQPTESVWASSNILWDQSNNQVQQGNVSAHYDAADGSILNVAYRYNQADATVSTLANGLRQADISGALPLNRRWRLLARINYDLALHTPLEDLIGVEYENCCWVTRIAYQRAALAKTLDATGQPQLERDRSLVIEFQLKGLGGLGQKMETLLQESIWGYRDRY